MAWAPAWKIRDKSEPFSPRVKTEQWRRASYQRGKQHSEHYSEQVRRHEFRYCGGISRKPHQQTGRSEQATAAIVDVALPEPGASRARHPHPILDPKPPSSLHGRRGERRCQFRPRHPRSRRVPVVHVPIAANFARTDSGILASTSIEQPPTTIFPKRAARAC